MNNPPGSAYNPYDPNVMDEINQLGFENQDLQQKNLELQGALASASMQDLEEQNLIKYQLETDRILERMEHFYKGDQIKFSDKGSYFAEPTKKVLCRVYLEPKNNFKYYLQEIKESKKGTETKKEVIVKIENAKNESLNIREEDSQIILSKLKKIQLKDLGYLYAEVVDEEKKPLNEYGVAEMMRILSNYVTKETFLSYYTEERIMEIMADLGNEMNKFLYCNYEKIGMDTKFKESKYLLILVTTLHVVENCYRRAIGGREQENLRKRTFTSQGSSQQSMPMSVPKKRWNPFKMSTW